MNTLIDFCASPDVLFVSGDMTQSMYVCRLCGSSYKYKTSLFNHEKFECGKEPSFACPFCPYKGKQKVHLKKHMFLKHKHMEFVKRESIF